MGFIDELKRRNVIRVAIGYIAVAWLIVQVIETLFSIFGISEAVAQTIVIVLAIGFVPALVIAWKFELTPEGLKRDADADRSAPGMRELGSRFDRAITVVLILAVSYFAVDKFVIDPGRDEEMIAAAIEQVRIDELVASFGDRSIAVLPFVNMGNDEEQEFFADGITEELLNLLAQIGDLRVISRSSAFQYKGKDIHVPSVARELRVAHVLEGSVRRDGDTIRVTAQLIDASDRHLWSDTYDREFRAVFAIQDEIAAKVVDSLKVHLLGGAPKTRKRDPEAYALLLRAKYLLNLQSDAATDEASELLQEAQLLEPDDPDILTHSARVLLRRNGTNEETRRRVMAMVERVEKTDPTYGNGWRAFFAFELDGDLKAGARFAEAALRAAPNDLDMLRPGAFWSSMLGAAEEAIAIGEYIVAMDPLCGRCQYDLARAYRLNGQLDEAEVAARAALILLGDKSGLPILRDLGRTLFFQGRLEEALDTAIEADDLQVQAAALHGLGRETEFEEVLQQAVDQFEGRPSGVAWIYAAIGDNEAALEWLAKPTDANPAGLGRELDYWVYRNLRDDPRFIAMREEIGISPAQLEAINFQPPLPPGVTIN